MSELEDRPGWALLRSQLECPQCHDVVASIHRHDFRSCRCGATGLDGGLDYLRIAADWIFAMSPEERLALDKSIFIAGPHDRASKVLALNIFKSLWSASERGQRWATTFDVRDHMHGRGEDVTTTSLLAYLKLFVETECVQQERKGPGFVWMPLKPLVERADAP